MPPLILLLWILAGLILYLIIHSGMQEDIMLRTVTSIDRYKTAFFACAALPFIWFGIHMNAAGFGALFWMNLFLIALFWMCGKLGMIGGADAYIVILCGIVFPYVFPLIACFGLSAFAVRFCRNEQNAEDWEKRGIPYFVPLRWGYLITVPLAVLFASLFF